MAAINSVVLVGNLTRDAEIRYTNTGTAIVKFSLAINRKKKVGDVWQDESHFFDVTMMGKGAEGVQKYLTKGKQVAVSGELRQNRWEQDGQARSKVEVFAFNLQLCGGSGGGGGSGSSYAAAGAGNSGNQAGSYDSYSGQDEQFVDDIPF